MSSIPVQFLIYAIPLPTCSKIPVIIPLSRCFEVKIGVSVTFKLYAMNYCDKAIATLSSITVTQSIDGMTASALTSEPTNSSLSYVTYTWTPQADQIGFQELCAVAYTR